MHRILYVGAGGFVGASLRYLITMGTNRLLAPSLLPWGTLAANVLGCLMIGFLSGLYEQKGLFGEEVRLLLITGLLGGLTTFSTYGWESLSLFRQGGFGLGLANLGLHLGLGLTAVALGDWLAELV